MSPQEWIYALVLIICLPLGFILKNIPGCRNKQLFAAAVGVALVLFTSGVATAHSVITAFVNCLLIVVIGPRKCHIWSFIWCFGYLVFFRTTHFIGLPKVPPYANAVQLLLTLKMVGLAFEVHDSDSLKKRLEKESDDNSSKGQAELQYKHQAVEPSLVDMMLYAFCYIGLVTGPYYRYRTYHDMVCAKSTAHIPSLEPMLKRLMRAPVYALSFLIASEYFTVQYLETAEFYEQPFWYRFFYMTPVFLVFRFRMYSAWILSECMCMTTCLGAYPAASKPRCGQGPTDLEALNNVQSKDLEKGEYNYEAIHNIDEWGTDFGTSLRDGMRSWNMSVQYWLATYVYRRVSNKSIRTSVTMAVSSFWHGIHPGYYLSFLTVPPSLMGETAMIKAFRDGASPQTQKIFDWACWFFKMRSFDYMCMGFLLLRWDSTIRFWQSIYFAGHIYSLAFFFIGTLWVMLTRKPQERIDLKKEK